MAPARNVTEATSSWDPYERSCPSRDLLHRIGDKWSILVIGELAEHGSSRFTELRKRLSGVSEKMLTQTLRNLERDGLVLRTVHAAVPVRVQYELTPLGQTLRAPIKALTEWSLQHTNDVLAAREDYDARAEQSPDAASRTQGETMTVSGSLPAPSQRAYVPSPAVASE